LFDQLDQYYVISECVYRKQMVDDLALLNFFWGKTDILMSDIIEAIKNDKIYGIAKVDISCPDEAKTKENGCQF
jgi:hypothetical protein